jgi:uncharacterized protein
MQILIDGYNLLFGANPAADILKEEREGLIHLLVKWLKAAGIEATIVFDSYVPDTPETRGHLGPLEVIFTSKGELADELILKRIKSSAKPHQILLVTSDKRLALRARRYLAKVQTVQEWVKHLRKLALKKEQPPIKEKPSPPLKKPPKKREHDLAFYQEIFEAEEPPKKKSAKKIIESEEERWLRLFEEKFRNGA